MVTNNAWNSQNPAQVALGGTGSASFTAYGPVVAASTTTGALTSVSPSATSGVPLISQGASANPAFGTAVVAGGGTGVTSATAYAVLCGGTTTTNPFQSIASVGTSGQVLTSNGAGALPTFQAVSAAGSALIKIQTLTASSSATISFTTGITNTYTNYLITINNMVPQTTAKTLNMQVSSNGGVSYLNTGYVTRTSVTNTSNALGSSTSTTAFILSIANDIVSSTTQPYCAHIFLYDVSDGNVPTISGQVTYQSTAASTVDTGWFYGYGPTSTTVNAIQFAMSSGNITSGSFTLYGIVQ